MTTPDAPLNDAPEATTEVATPPTPAPHSPAPKAKVRGSLAGGTWVALIFGTLLMIVLLIFILQNQQQVDLNLFAWSFQVPAGVGFLLAAITGALIMAIVGGVRMLELRRQVKNARKAALQV